MEHFWDHLGPFRALLGAFLGQVGITNGKLTKHVECIIVCGFRQSATSAPQRDQFLGQIESLRKYLEAHLGAILGHVRASWAILGPSWSHLGPSWGILGPSWGHLGPSWGHLGASWGHLGAILGHLRPSWDHLEKKELRVFLPVKSLRQDGGLMFPKPYFLQGKTTIL